MQTLTAAGRNASVFGQQVFGDVDLDSCKFDDYLSIRNTTFHGHVNLRNLTCAHTFDLSGCVFKRNVILAGAQVGGSLVLRNVTIERYPQPPRLLGMDKSRDDVADLERLRVDGNLDLEGIWSYTALDLTDARVEGRFWLASSGSRVALVGGDLEAPDLKAGRQMSLFGVDVAGKVNIQSAEFAKDLFVRPYCARAMSIGNQLWMVGASVAGVINISGEDVRGDVQLRNAHVKEDLIANPFDAGPELGMLPTVIGGDLVTAGAYFKADLDLSGIHVDGTVALDGCRYDGDSRSSARTCPAHEVKPHRRRARGPAPIHRPGGTPWWTRRGCDCVRIPGTRGAPGVTHPRPLSSKGWSTDLLSAPIRVAETAWWCGMRTVRRQSALSILSPCHSGSPAWSVVTTVGSGCSP